MRLDDFVLRPQCERDDKEKSENGNQLERDGGGIIYTQNNVVHGRFVESLPRSDRLVSKSRVRKRS